MNPPWIILNIFILWQTGFCRGSDLEVAVQGLNSTDKHRPQREITDRERRLIPYMTFYVAQNVRNPNSGQNQNILIPIRTHQATLERINGVPQIQTNNIQNVAPSRFEMPVTQPVPVRFSSSGFYPTPSVEITPKGRSEAVRILGQIYRFKSPGPQIQHPQQYQQQHHQHQQQIPRPMLQQTQVITRPQIIKIIPYNPNYDYARYLVTAPPLQNTYTGAAVQTLSNNPYLTNEQAYYKTAAGPTIDVPRKVYAVNIIPQKIAIQRLRPRPEKTTSNQMFGTTTPSPYGTSLKFGGLDELHIVPQVDKERESTTASYSPEHVSSNFIGEQGHIPKIPNKEQEVHYAHEISQDRPNQVTFVPVHVPTPTLNPQAVEIQQVGPVNGNSDSQIDHIQLVHEVNTPRPQVHETNDISPAPQGLTSYEEYDNEKPLNDDFKTPVDSSVVNLLTILKQTNQLPQNLTPENIDNSIKTLALILNRLQHEKKYHASKVKSRPKPATVIITEEKHNKIHNYEDPSVTSTPGRPGIDYPTYATIPQTQFDCATQRFKGFFGDPETNCQVWHYCDLNGGQASFLCPNGTIFSQVALTCDWWFNVKCASTSQLYVLNERLYKYILPFSPSFPEDYSGPLVDRYLAAKFKEMEAKSRLKALKSLISTTKPTSPTEATTADPSPVHSTEAQS